MDVAEVSRYDNIDNIEVKTEYIIFNLLRRDGDKTRSSKLTSENFYLNVSRQFKGIIDP